MVRFDDVDGEEDAGVSHAFLKLNEFGPLNELEDRRRVKDGACGTGSTAIQMTVEADTTRNNTMIKKKSGTSKRSMVKVINMASLSQRPGMNSGSKKVLSPLTGLRPCTAVVRTRNRVSSTVPKMRAQTSKSRNRGEVSEFSNYYISDACKRFGNALNVHESHLDPYVGKYTPDKLILSAVLRDLRCNHSKNKNEDDSKNQDQSITAAQVAAIKGLIAAVLYRNGSLLPWVAGKVLGPIWEAYEGTTSPVVTLLVLRLVRELTATGEPWFRALLDHNVLGKASLWAFSSPTKLAGALSEESNMDDKDTEPAYGIDTGIGVMDFMEGLKWPATPSSKARPRLPVADLKLSSTELQDEVFNTVYKLARCAYIFCTPSRDGATTMRHFVRAGGLVVLTKLCVTRQDRSTLNSFDIEWDRLVFDPWNRCGMGKAQTKETVLCARKFFDAHKAVQSDLAMVKALGLPPNESTISLLDLVKPDIKLHGRAATGCGFQDSEAIHDMLIRAQRSFDRMQKREIFRQKCKQDWQTIQQDKKQKQKEEKEKATKKL